MLDITVLPDFQGSGVGTTLIERLQAEAARVGVPLRESVFRGNQGAEALYRRLGFVEVGGDGAYLAMEWWPDADPPD